MATSTQKLLIMIIAINLVLGIALTAYDNPTVFAQGPMDTFEAQGQEYSDRMNSMPNETRIPEALEIESSYGNTWTMTKLLFDVFVNSIHPFPFSGETFDSTLEKAFAIALMTFRTLLGFIVFLEIILVIKNRKAT